MYGGRLVAVVIFLVRTERPCTVCCGARARVCVRSCPYVNEIDICTYRIFTG